MNDKRDEIRKILTNALQEAEMRQGCTDYSSYVNALMERLNPLVVIPNWSSSLGASHPHLAHYITVEKLVEATNE